MATKLTQKLSNLTGLKRDKDDDDAEDGSSESASEKKLDMSPEEANRLEQCFKDPKFRDLLVSYCEEIANPKTRLAYEEYLRQVEKESDQPKDRKLIKPKPGFVIKLRKDPKKMKLTKTKSKSEMNKNNITLKVFINCCFADCVEDARLGPNTPATRPINSTGDERAGICWQIPYILGHVRVEKDAVGNYCDVVDIAFAENTIKACKQDTRFAQIVIQTAIEAVETNAKLKFHEKYKVLKNIEAKGEPAMMSINTTKAPTLKDAWNEQECENTQFIDKDVASKQAKDTKSKKSKHQSKIKSNRNKVSKISNKKESNKENNNKNNKTSNNKPCAPSSLPSGNKKEEIDEKCVENEKVNQVKVIKPECRIVESGDMNLQEFWSDKSLVVAPLRRPKRLILKISLPNVGNVENINTNIVNETETEQNDTNALKMIQYFELNEKESNTSKTRYYLKVKLPYLVITNENDDNDNDSESMTNVMNLQHKSKGSMSAHWYASNKELHVTLTVRPFTRQDFEKFKQEMTHLKMKSNNNTKVCEMEKNDEITQNSETISPNKSNTSKKIDTNIQSALDNVTNSDKNENITIDPCENESDANANAIDKILQLDLNQNEHGTEKTKDDNTNCVETNQMDNVTKQAKTKTKSKSKKKKQSGAIQSGFLLNITKNKNGSDTQSESESSDNEDASGLKKNKTKPNHKGKNDANDTIKEMKEYNYEFRERLNRVVLVFRVENIIEKGVSVLFDKLSLTVSFETKKSAFYKKFNLMNEIDCEQCSFDLNRKNLLIMLVKKDENIWNQIERNDEITVGNSDDSQIQDIAATLTTEPKNEDDNKDTILDNLLNDDDALDLE